MFVTRTTTTLTGSVGVTETITRHYLQDKFMMVRKGRVWRNVAEKSDKGKDVEMRGRIVEVGIPLWNRDGLKRHIQFKAGKMYTMDNIVYPDPRKGLVYIDQDPDHVMHFCWKERDGVGTKETDLTPDPYDSSFMRVTKCTTGRVYLLKIRSAKQNHFFWMQEPSEEKDSEICNRVNYLLNFPPLRLRFPQIACNFEVAQRPCQATIDGDLNSLDTSADTELEEVSCPNQYDLDELRNIEEEFLLISTMTKPEEHLSSDNPELSYTVSPDMMRPILENAELRRQLKERDRETLKTPVESVCSETAMSVFDTAARLGTLIPTLKNLGFSKRIVDAALKGDWQIFINNLSRVDSESDRVEGKTDPDWFQKLKSIIFLQDSHTYKAPEVLKADIDKIVGALAECNIDNSGVGAGNGNAGQRSDGELIGVSISTENRIVKRKREHGVKSGAHGQVSVLAGDEKRALSSEHDKVDGVAGLDGVQGVNVEVFQGVILKTSSKSEGLNEPDNPATPNNLEPNPSREAVEQEHDQSFTLERLASQTVSACGTQTEGPGYQSKTSLCNRVSRKLLGKTETSQPSCSYSTKSSVSNTEKRIGSDTRQSGNPSSSLAFEINLDQPGCSYSWNPDYCTGLKDARAKLTSRKKDGATNTDYYTEWLNCRPSTSTQESADTADSVGAASLNSSTDETIATATAEPTFVMLDNNERPQSLKGKRDETRILAIRMDNTDVIPEKTSAAKHGEVGSSSDQPQKSGPSQSSGTPITDSNNQELGTSPALVTPGTFSEDVIFVCGPYYESQNKTQESSKTENSVRRSQDSQMTMNSGVQKRKGEPGLVELSTKRARKSSPDPHPPKPFIVPKASSVQPAAGGRRYPGSRRSTNLLGAANNEDDPGNSSRKRPNDLEPPDQDEPPAKKARASSLGSSQSDSGNSSKKRRPKNQKPNISKTQTPPRSTSSGTATTRSTPQALKLSDSKVSEASSRKGEVSPRYNLRRRSTEQDTRLEVDSEQQTEPVRIREIMRAGPETRLRTISRAPRAGTMTNRDRSQNTEPVLIEDKSKPKDQKPSESSKKPGA